MGQRVYFSQSIWDILVGYFIWDFPVTWVVSGVLQVNFCTILVGVILGMIRGIVGMIWGYYLLEVNNPHIGLMEEL